MVQKRRIASKEEIRRLKEIARQLRLDVVEMTTAAGSGHPGGALSSADIVTALFFKVMRHDPKNPAWPERDRFHLSKGHSCPIVYAALAHAGYFSKEELKTLRKLGSILQGHPDARRTPGIDVSSGSLGHGLSIACGMAMALKLDKRNSKVYNLLGDGETQEGAIWEAAMFAAHYKLDNLIAIVDYNGQQIDGWVDEVMSLKPFGEKWEAFGWKVYEIDGHDFRQIIRAFHLAQKSKKKPVVIIAKTIKGKGVSFMENNPDFHGKAATKEEAEQALRELGCHKTRSSL